VSLRITRIGPDGAGLVIVHEQVAEFGGAERVLETALDRYPAAATITMRFDSPPGGMAGELELRLAERGIVNGHAGGSNGSRRITFVGHGGLRNHFLSPVYARRIRATPIENASVVLTTGSMGWTSAVRPPEGVRHIAYAGGPPRALYGHSRPYLADQPQPLRLALRAAIPALRAHHRALLQRPSRLVANSRMSADGLSRIAGRPVGVLYPPVRTNFFTPDDREGTRFVAVSRVRRHKRLDLIIEAFRGLGEHLVVAGDGPQLASLRADAPANVQFVGQLGDADLRELYRSSRALISVSVEEFGICLAEAQAAGIPVIAPRAGGSGEIVIDGETGILLDRVEPAEVAAAALRVERLGIDPMACRRSAERFSEERFLAGLAALIED
jgi:glycosyltransferase involved in cell wall biosynthesis